VSLETDIVAWLERDEALGAVIDDRIYPMPLPQSPTLPALTYFRVDTPREYSQSGYSRLAHPRMQFSCWAWTLLEAADVASLVRQAMERWGEAACFAATELDLYEPETRIYHRVLDMIIWHNEEV